MYQLTVSFNTEEELLAYIEARARSIVAGAAPAAGESDKPSRKGRKATTTETPAPAATPAAAPVDPNNVLGLPAAASPSLDTMLGLGNSAAQLPPAATPAPVALPPAAPAPVAAAGPTQQDVIKAFVVLGQTPGKGIDAIKSLLAPYGVTTVTAIKPEHFAHAIAAVKQALGQ